MTILINMISEIMTFQIFLYMGVRNKQLAALTTKRSPGMLPVLDRPLINRVISTVSRQGFSRVLLAMELLPEQIEQYLSNGNRWNLDLDYILLPKHLGDASAMKWSQSKLDGPFVVAQADMLLDFDLAPLIERHCDSDNVVTMLGHTRKDDRQIYSDEYGRLTKTESGNKSLSATGVYVVDPSALSFVPLDTDFDIYEDLLPSLLDANKPVGVVETSAYWNPLSSYNEFHEAQKAFLQSSELDGYVQRYGEDLPLHPELFATRYGDGIWVGPDNSIHPSALLTPPVYIGARCKIGQAVELGPHAYIGSDIVVDAAATISNSTILNNTYVGELVNVEGRIVDGRLVIDIESGEEVDVTDDFLFASLDVERIYRDLGRPFEAVVALMMLVLVLPILLPLMLVVWMVNKKIFQTQPHVVSLDQENPEHDKTTRLYLLNTNQPNGNVNAFGRFLERWEIFRLPALWNVVRGDIRLVGLSPLTPQEAALVEPYWRIARRGEVAGITGLWYVQAGANSELDERMAADAFYLATHDRWHKITLVLRSPLVWWRRNSAIQQTSQFVVPQQIIIK